MPVRCRLLTLAEEWNTSFRRFFSVSGFSSLRYLCDSLLNIQTKRSPFNNVTPGTGPSLVQEMDYEQLSGNVEVNDLESEQQYLLTSTETVDPL